MTRLPLLIQKKNKQLVVVWLDDEVLSMIY